MAEKPSQTLRTALGWGRGVLLVADDSFKALGKPYTMGDIGGGGIVPKIRLRMVPLRAHLDPAHGTRGCS